MIDFSVYDLIETINSAIEILIGALCYAKRCHRQFLGIAKLKREMFIDEIISVSRTSGAGI